ncbi:MAG: hypothetical protein ACLURP_00365 [Ruminococcus sp.]
MKNLQGICGSGIIDLIAELSSWKAGSTSAGKLSPEKAHLIQERDNQPVWNMHPCLVLLSRRTSTNSSAPNPPLTPAVEIMLP